MDDLPLHGGGLARAQKRWPHFTDDWLDLSTGINPYPYPVNTIEFSPHLWSHLPDSDLQEHAVQAARCHYGLRQDASLLVTPGSGAIIRHVPFMQTPTTVAVLGPTYGEHMAAWSAAGHRVQQREGLAACGDARVVVVVNPNNPDGRIIPPDQIVWFANKNPDRLIVVDQAFGDVCPEYSVVPALTSNMVVLSSLGKFFGLAGLRVGFIMANPIFTAQISERLGPWPVSGPALHLVRTVLEDTVWIEQTRQRLKQESAKLDLCLARHGLAAIGGTTLFRLISRHDALALWNHLGRHGILTRIFTYEPSWLRLGLPPSDAALARLDAVLSTA